MSLTVLRCIGCGAIETSQPCLGTCIDRRLDLVEGRQHAAAAAALAELEAALAASRTLLGRLARAAGWEALRAPARAALRVSAEVVEAETVTTWACDSCGRIEAPQPCIGVCVRPPTAMVPAAEHAVVVEAARAAQRDLARFAPVLRQIAWATPRPEHVEEMGRALRAAAQALM